MSIAPQAAVPTAARLVAAAAGALALGIVVYLVDRPAGSAQLLPAAWHAARPLGVFGPFGSVVPDLAHAFALSVLTGLLARTRRAAAAACVAWWLVDSLLEVAQWQVAAQALRPHLPAFVATYLQRGTFDVADLAAIALGAWLAYALLARVQLAVGPGPAARRRARERPPERGVTTLPPASSRAITRRPSSSRR
jgi:hypothetical protein